MLCMCRLNRSPSIHHLSNTLHRLSDDTFRDLLALRKSYRIFTVYLVDTAAADAVMRMIL